jgi:ATP-dependent Clp protease ATP-binding subunit ClpX
MGFGADIRTNREEKNIGEILAQTQPEDLLKFGLIPEFVGRLPVIATLDELDQNALVRILTEPKNSLIKQYQKLFEFEDVKLKFTEDSLVAVASEAMRRKSGARGLRAILEKVMLETMYELPSQSSVHECVISEEVILKGEQPILLYEQKAETG